MISDASKIMQWRNERCKKANFKTQREYDDKHQALQELRKLYLAGQISRKEVWLELVKVHLYGKVAAERVICLWENKYEKEKENEE